MGDAPGIALLSLAPLLIIVVLMVAAVVAWRSGRRSVRIGVGFLLIILGASTLLPGPGLLFSLAGGAVLVVVGLALVIAEYRRGSVD